MTKPAMARIRPRALVTTWQWYLGVTVFEKITLQV
jgi:hypothetical protein